MEKSVAIFTSNINGVWKSYNLVLVSSNKPASLMIYKGEMLFAKDLGFDVFDETKNFRHTNRKELVIIADEVAVDGDYYFDEHNGLVLKATSQSDHKAYNYKKVIAYSNETFDSNVPKIPDTFIHYYVVEYNKGNIIEEVNLKFELYLVDKEKVGYKLKVKASNTVIVALTSRHNATRYTP